MMQRMLMIKLIKHALHHRFYLQVQPDLHLKPFKLARLTVEARKLFNTPEAYIGYVTLGALAVFDDNLTGIKT